MDVIIPERGLFVRSRPSGWKFSHTLDFWLACTFATVVYYFSITPFVGRLELWALLAWLPIGAALLWLAARIPERWAMTRCVRRSITYVVVLVAVHLFLSRGAPALGDPNLSVQWIAAMCIGALVAVLQELRFAARLAPRVYAVGLYPDRFEHEREGRVVRIPWTELTLALDPASREYIVSGNGAGEIRLDHDLPGRDWLARIIELKTGRPVLRLAAPSEPPPSAPR